VTEATEDERSERVLVLMTNRNDADRTVEVLAAAGLDGVACADEPHLGRELERGAGALLVTEEALLGDRADDVRAALAAQPAWSSVPLVAVVREGAAVGRRESLLSDLAANVTLIERPLRMRTLVSVVRGAIRARRHQYDIRDAIADRDRRAEQLRASEERYRTLFESMDEGYCVIEVLFDPPGGTRAVDYRFLEVNPAFETQAGMPNPVGRRMLEFVPSIEDHWLDNYGRVALTGEPVRFENEYKTLNRWFDVYAFRVGRPDERRVAVLFSDVTGRKESEARVAALVESLREQDKRKDEFLATLAHELRNPLAPIRSGLAVLGMSPLDGPAAELVPMMERQLTHLVHLVDDLLDVSRVTSGRITLHRERFDLREAVTAAIETCRPAIDCARHLFDARVPATPVWVDGDATRLAQVITNLLTNACKYTPDGGRIELTVDTEGEAAVVRVTDDGVGIPADMLPKVFDTFTQVGRSIDRSQGGLGLGLALVRRLAEKHGGTAEVRSPGPDQGCTVTVRLPLAGAAPPGETSSPGEAPPPGSETEAADSPLTPPVNRILVVDDLRPSAMTLAMMLKALGQDARAENDGHSALRTIREFRPQVVISDIAMPGMDGYELARRLRTADGPRPILVALTGYGQDEDRRRAFDAGFDHHLVKPTSVDALRELLASLPAVTAQEAARNGSAPAGAPSAS